MEHGPLLREIGTGYTAAWNSGNPAAVAAYYDEQGSLKVNEADYNRQLAGGSD